MKNDDLCLICGKQREPGLEPMKLKWTDDKGRHSMDLAICRECYDDIERAAAEEEKEDHHGNV